MEQPDNFGFEIDFLPVGEGDRSGDAICMRWGVGLKTNHPQQKVMVVDGGFAVNAGAIVSHLRKYYKTTHIDYLVVSHPHQDHIGGVKELFEYQDQNEKVTIGTLWMHNPDKHIELDCFKNPSIKKSSVKKSINTKLPSISDILSLAAKKQTKHVELFTDFEENDIGLGVRCYVLNPSKEFYEQLLPSFSSTPSEGEFSGGARLSYTGNEIDAKKALLTDDGKTSAENESSSVLCLALPGGELILLTGDAGMDALNNCLLNAKSQGLNLSANIRVFKVPHHGSIQNLSGKLLDGILGDSCSARLRKTAYAMVMVSKHPAKGHPDKIVTNNIWQRNCKPYKTGGSTLSYGVGEFPDRGWGPATPIEKFDRVDQVV